MKSVLFLAHKGGRGKMTLVAHLAVIASKDREQRSLGHTASQGGAGAWDWERVCEKASLLLIVLMITSYASLRSAHSLEKSHEYIVVKTSELSSADSARLAERLASERRKVRQWWGPTFEDEITVEVSSTHRELMALVPAWEGKRGFMTFPLSGALRRSALHELVQIYAPNGNRFLAEGLASYVGQELGINSQFNFGNFLHLLAWPLRRDADLLALDRIHTPAPLELTGRLDSGDAYAVAGSFIGYLIEQHGMEKFRQLYDLTPLVPGDRHAGGNLTRWESVYGISLESLAKRWIRYITPFKKP